RSPDADAHGGSRQVPDPARWRSGQVPAQAPRSSSGRISTPGGAACLGQVGEELVEEGLLVEGDLVAGVELAELVEAGFLVAGGGGGGGGGWRCGGGQGRGGRGGG